MTADGIAPPEGRGLAWRRRGARTAGWLARVLGRHGIPCLAILVGLVLNAAVMTDGQFDLSVREAWFTEFYDELGKSMLHGRFDVPRDTLQFETFLIGGRAYGYFGPTPALVRIPLNLLFPSMHGRWARWMVLACCATSLGAFYSLLRQARRLLAGADDDSVASQYASAALLLAASVGTTLFVVSKRAVVYHEAIAFGAALALVSFALLPRYLTGRAGLRTLLASAVCALLSFLARQTVGSGPLFAMLVVGAWLSVRWVTRAVRGTRSAEGGGGGRGPLALPDPPRIGRHLLAFASLMAVGLGFIAFRNVRTLGNVMGTIPLQHHVSYINNPARLARTGGSFVQPKNFRTMARAYFGPDGLVVKPRFPWFALRGKAFVYPEARMDYQEPAASLPAAYTFWTVLLLVGIVALAWPRQPDVLASLRLVVLAAAVGFLPTMIAAAISMRYLHDLFPFVIAASAVGAAQLLVLYRQQHRWVRVAMPLLVVLALYTCATSVAVAVAVVR